MGGGGGGGGGRWGRPGQTKVYSAINSNKEVEGTSARQRQ